MTYDERISSYIDNELTPEMEQEFLISLAASDGLRRSFRSELVLKKVLHRDEMLTAPPRELRAAIFATVGLGAAALGASKANAATVSSAASQTGSPAVSGSAGSTASHGFLKTLFATKMNALLTAAGLSISALAGYGAHSLTSEPAHTQQVRTEQVQPVESHISQPQQVTEQTANPVSQKAAETNAKFEARALSHTSRVHSTSHSAKPASNVATDAKLDTTPASGVAGGSSMQLNAPVIGNKK